MVKINPSKLIVTLLAIFFVMALMAEVNKKDIIVAEFAGEIITLADIEQRIAEIPPMQQGRFNNNEGKVELLKMLCTEELFYQEALALGMDNSDEVIGRTDPQVKTFYTQEYKKSISERSITFTDEEKRNYFSENKTTMFAGRTYEEVSKELEMRMRPSKVKEITDSLIKALTDKYEIVLNEDILGKLNLEDMESSRAIESEIYLTSNKPEFEHTLKYVIDTYKYLDPRTQTALTSLEDLIIMMKSHIEMDLFYMKALEEGLNKREDLVKKETQIRRIVILRSTYNKIIVETIPQDDDGALAYYEENIAKFSSTPSRKIQAFVFATKDKAEELYPAIKKLVKKNKVEQLNELIQANSKITKDNGAIDNIYHNGIIPGIGKDQYYNDKIFDIPSKKVNIKKLSKIFETINGDFVFFRILEDNVAIPEDFVEIMTKVKSTMMRDISKERFEAKVAELENKFNLVKYEDRLIVKLSAEEYFTEAEESQKKRRYNDAVYYYDKIIEYYPATNHEYKAAFMKAFLYAEEINDKRKAIELFEKFLEDYDEGDLHESARFMLGELNGNSNLIEKFEDTQSIE